MKLLYFNEHSTCKNYALDSISGFKYLTLKKGEVLSNTNKDYNHLFFVLKGEIEIFYDEYRCVFKTGEMFFIPKSSNTIGRAFGDTELVTHVFDNLMHLCDRFALEELEPYCRNIDYEFKPLLMRKPLLDFLTLMAFYLKEKVLCKHIFDVKQKELFFLFRAFYSKKEVATLFFSIISGNIDFTGQVLRNYQKSKTVQDLANACCLSLTTFNRKFKTFFKDSPYNWMLKQKSRHIRGRLCNPNVSIGDIIEEFGFSSSGHFTSYCKMHFNMTPTQLRKALKAQEAVIDTVHKDV